MKNKEISVCSFNCQCTAGYGNKSLLPILDVVGAENLKTKSSVYIFNELYKTKDFPKFKEKLKELDYIVVEDSRDAKRGENHVLVAIDKELGVDIVEYIHSNSDSEQPDFLSVVLKINGEDYAIVGARIKWHGQRVYNEKTGRYGYKITEDTFKNRMTEFKFLMNHLDQLKERGIEKIIIGADWNTAKSRHPEGQELSEESIEAAYEGYLQKHYNYEKIKLAFEERGFFVVTPDNEIGSIRNKSGAISAIKLDHVMVNFGDVVETKYVFDQKGVSDHAMITAKIML